VVTAGQGSIRQSSRQPKAEERRGKKNEVGGGHLKDVYCEAPGFAFFVACLA